MVLSRVFRRRMGLMLDLSAPGSLEKVLYFASYIVTDPGRTQVCNKTQVLSEREYQRSISIKYGDRRFQGGHGRRVQ